MTDEDLCHAHKPIATRWAQGAPPHWRRQSLTAPLAVPCARSILRQVIPLASTPPTVIVALIGACASLLVALVSGFFTYRNTTRVHEFERLQKEEDAQLAYRYEARKRLYAVCEPVLFQVAEQSQYAKSRICSLARSAREGEIRPDGQGWLSTPQGYYFRSTVYGLLAPLTAFTSLQRQLTTIDLQLDPTIRRRYEMLRLIFLSPGEDWDLARHPDEELEYNRNRSDAGERDRETRLRESPQRYAPQGLYRGTIYVVAEALTAVPTDSPGVSGEPLTRCISQGEFDRAWEAAGASEDSRPGNDQPVAPRPLAPIYDTLVELFGGFHPSRKPVLWRVLVYQYMLYRALLSPTPEFVPLTAEEEQTLSWRPAGEGEPDHTLSIAQAHASRQLASLS
jgi:hypothetical protein